MPNAQWSLRNGVPQSLPFDGTDRLLGLLDQQQYQCGHIAGFAVVSIQRLLDLQLGLLPSGAMLTVNTHQHFAGIDPCGLRVLRGAQKKLEPITVNHRHAGRSFYALRDFNLIAIGSVSQLAQFIRFAGID